MTENKSLEIDKNNLILRKSGIQLQEEPDKWGFLYDPERDSSYGLNGISIFIWKQLELNLTFNQLIDKVKTIFVNIPPEIETEIMVLLAGFAGKGLIIFQNSTPGDAP
jgi:hypothetical protein